MAPPHRLRVAAGAAAVAVAVAMVVVVVAGVGMAGLAAATGVPTPLLRGGRAGVVSWVPIEEFTDEWATFNHSKWHDNSTTWYVCMGWVGGGVGVGARALGARGRGMGRGRGVEGGAACSVPRCHCRCHFILPGRRSPAHPNPPRFICPVKKRDPVLTNRVHLLGGGVRTGPLLPCRRCGLRLL